MLHVLYLVHDLSDPAVRRRVIMLKAGGATVTLAGFRRSADPVGEVDGLTPIDLGMTRDGKFVQRLGAVGMTALSLGAKLKHVRKPDLVIGRSLEMLALANRLSALFCGTVPVVYECLDIHRLLLRRDGVGRAMRAAERAFGRNAVLLITSSPAFVREYFQPLGQIKAPVLVVHNKVLEIGGAPETAPHEPPDGGPWRIGWFGALRCRKSLELLCAFTRRMAGRFEVILRGRPAYREFEDFDRTVAAEPHLRFAGAYRNPEDLAAIYGEVHLTWAIDFFEERMNSNWLLPNRLYEGCRYGAVPIAMRQTETGRFLAVRGLGFLLSKASVDGISGGLGDLDSKTYALARAKVARQDDSTWICGPSDCRALVERLGQLANAVGQGAVLEAVA
jgi:succinoglycan biosynthesis protein ExoL